MPALFTYLIAIGLLLGGGYGALTWLAAPEPMKVVAKAKPIPRPHFDEASRETIGQSDQIAVGSKPPPVAPPAEASTAPIAQSAQAEASVSTQTEASVTTQVRQNPAVNAAAANAEVASAEAERAPEPAQSAQAASPLQAASTGSQTTAASSAAAVAAKTVKPRRPHQQRLGSRSEKPALALMTLRTIEFPDGHRVTQLLPYRGGDPD
jgi:hypothetical protein